jgi:hypothetical protein
MIVTRLLLGCSLCFSIHAQVADGTTVGVRAAQLSALLRDSPSLAVEQVPVSVRLPIADSLGIVSSLASGQNGVVYALQRGDKVEPVIVTDRKGEVLRSWCKGMFTAPHSIRIDLDGNIWTVYASNSMVLKLSPEGTKLQEIRVGEAATGKDRAFPTLCGTTDITFAPGGRLFHIRWLWQCTHPGIQLFR